MYKADFVTSLSQNSGLSKTACSKFLNAITDVITNAMAEGDEVTLQGLGKFVVIDKKEKKGTNPVTGDILIIPAKKAVKFKPSKVLKEELNKED